MGLRVSEKGFSERGEVNTLLHEPFASSENETLITIFSMIVVGVASNESDRGMTLNLMQLQ